MSSTRKIQLKPKSVDKEAALSAPWLDMADMLAYTQDEARQRAFAWSQCGVDGVKLFTSSYLALAQVIDIKDYGDGYANVSELFAMLR